MQHGKLHSTILRAVEVFKQTITCHMHMQLSLTTDILHDFFSKIRVRLPPARGPVCRALIMCPSWGLVETRKWTASTSSTQTQNRPATQRHALNNRLISVNDINTKSFQGFAGQDCMCTTVNSSGNHTRPPVSLTNTTSCVLLPT